MKTLLVLLSAAVLLPGCRGSAPDDLMKSEETTAGLVFVKTEGEETLNRSWASGNLYKISPISPEGEVTPITSFVGASISDPCVSFDAQRILFSMRPPDGRDRNIYEIGADGTGLRQVTSGGGHDFDPLYLPSGKIMFTSSRAKEMDEYNHSLAEHLYVSNDDGSDITRISFNQSDDFDPTLMPDGRIIYTRWEHFGTFNRFPLFFTNPDGSQTFHKYGPHNRNFFHAQPTPNGRLIAIESSKVNEDAGPMAVLKLETGPADPTRADTAENWDVLNVDVNHDGPPWAHGAFKFPFPLGNDRYAVSYSLPAASGEECDFGLYTFGLRQSGVGTNDDPATFSIDHLTFLYNDPDTNEYDAQLLAPREKPPVVDPGGDPTMDSGVFLAHDIFNRGENDGQETPVRGVDAIDKLAVIVGIPTMQGEPNDISANKFEKRAILGFAPIYPDGSFRIRVPADLPISFSTLDELDRAHVAKRVWIYVRPGEEVVKCTGCHKARGLAEEHITNPNPFAETQAPTNLNVGPEDYTYITYRDDIAPIVESKCSMCHLETYASRDSLVLPDSVWMTVTDTIPPPGLLDLTSVIDTLETTEQTFPRAYINLSGASETLEEQVVVPAFPRRSLLIDCVLGVDNWQENGPHPDGEYALSTAEKTLFNYWVMLGAQYR